VADEVQIADCGLQIAGLQEFRHRRGPVPGIGGHGAAHGLPHPQPVRRVGVDDGGGDGLRPHQPPGGVVGVCEGAIPDEVAPRIPGVGDDDEVNPPISAEDAPTCPP